jgi:poly-gamma-glutamate synthesis protein (capsule biosynthesis protein)
VSFTDNCTYPLPDRMQFCSPAKYFDILKYAGFDIIELTGNHNNDYGAGANAKTIDLYEKEGMKFFGGGRNKAEAESVLYMRVKDIVFAFTGSNQWGPGKAWATENSAGAAKLSAELFDKSVKEAVSRADIVFVTVQWGNEDNPVPHKEQAAYFHQAADLGAHIMVSSSAHRAMGLEFYKNRFISYGLGNFLFDQMQTINHRRGLIARHHFYGKRHVQTEMIPYLIYNSSQPSIVEGKEAAGLFDYIYKYSIGGVFKK